MLSFVLVAGFAALAADAPPDCLAMLVTPSRIESAAAQQAVGSVVLRFVVSRKGIVTEAIATPPNAALVDGIKGARLYLDSCRRRTFDANVHFDARGPETAALKIAFTAPNEYRVTRDAGDEIPFCIAQLPRPVYPPLARQAGIQGSVRMRFDIDADGDVHPVVLEGHPLLGEGLRIKATEQTSQRCAGQAITVVYRFRLEDRGTHPPRSRVLFRLPNEFTISVARPELNVSSSEP